MKKGILHLLFLITTIQAFGNNFPENVISNINGIKTIQFYKTSQNLSKETFYPKLPLNQKGDSFYGNEIDQNKYDILTFSITNNTDEDLIDIRNRYYTCYDVSLYEVLNNNELIQIGSTQGNAHKISDNNHIDFIFKTK